MFESDELEKVIIASREPAKNSGVDEGNRDGIFDYFISRVRSNLHLVICMSPVGDAFRYFFRFKQNNLYKFFCDVRRRCRMFPSLVNCCTIDWFEKWPEEALLSVAQSTLTKVAEPELTDKLSHICVIVHKVC